MNRTSIIILIVCAIVVIIQSQCNRSVISDQTVEIIHDTEYVDQPFYFFTTDTIYLSKTEKGIVPDSLLKDTTCSTIKRRYSLLLDDYYAIRTFNDTLYNDSGFMSLNCKVSQNMMYDCSFNGIFTYPKVSTTIKTTTKAKRQIFFGGGVGTNTSLNALKANLGVLYMNRRQNITGFHVGTDTRFQDYDVMVTSYWLLKNPFRNMFKRRRSRIDTINR